MDGQAISTIIPGYCECGCGQKTALIKRTIRTKGRVKGQPSRFIQGHSRVLAWQNKRRQASPPAVKFCECGCGQQTNLAKQTVRVLGHVQGQPVRFVQGHGGVLAWKTKRQQAAPPAVKFCACGCGQQTGLARQSYTKKGQVKGQPYRFLPNHHRPPSGETNPNWKGGKTITKNGYVFIRQPKHPHANASGYIFEHILVAERALRKLLPPKTQIHHFNENPADNTNSNLVICDAAYHKLLHMRTRALKATGNPNFLICYFCHQWDDPQNLIINNGKAIMRYHRKCRSLYRQQYKQRTGRAA